MENLNKLKMLSFVLIPLVSILVGTIRYFFDPNKTDSISIIWLVFTIIIIPSVTVLINLLITRYNFDGTHESFKKTTGEIRKNSDDFLHDTNILISDSITRSNNYYNLHLNPHKDILTKFIPSLIDEFNVKIKALCNGYLFENDPSKYQKFCSNIFNLSEENSVIRATSIVDPNGFWEDENTINYFNNNKELIDKKGVKIERYFFVNDDNKDASLQAIANNIKCGVNVFIIEESKIKERFIKDCGTVNNNIVIESKVDGARNIYKVDVYIGNDEKFSEIDTLFKLLESKKTEAVVFYELTTEEITNLAQF
ncbi:hypothetical protein V3O24_15405 [Methylobacter sp. Wu8]|uniref:hypothetical protein n=1 Tax=Methylobacter sp. Wu8 TaxID=3118457 RepID=UPI002F342F84